MTSLIVASILFAASFGMISSHLSAVDPGFIAASRMALSFALFLPFFRWSAVLSGGRAVRLVMVGAVQFGLMYVLYQQAYQSLSGHEIALFTTLTPLHVVLVDAALRRRLEAGAFLAAALAISSAIVLAWRRPDAAALGAGFLLVQGANFCFALGQVSYRRWTGSRSPHHQVFAALYLGGFLVAGAVFVARCLSGVVPGVGPLALGGIDHDGVRIASTLTEWGVLAYLGLVPAGLGFYLWNVGATRVTTATLSAMNNLKAPLGVALALIVFQEPANLIRLTVSSVLIVLALVVASRSAPSSRVPPA